MRAPTNSPLTTAASLLRPRRRRAHCLVQLATVRLDVLVLEGTGITLSLAAVGLTTLRQYEDSIEVVELEELGFLDVD